RCHPMIPSGRLVRHRRLALAVACWLVWVAWAAGADPPKKTFRLPEGDAAVTLRQFSRQSGEQIVYPIDLVRGVKTNPVYGDYTARVALDQMVAGTELIVIQDLASGAITVGRRPAPTPPPNSSPRMGPASEKESPSTVQAPR